MYCRLVRQLFPIVLLLAVLFAAPLLAGTISYSTTDLGGGEWRYTYALSGFDLIQNEVVAIFFDETLYANLTAAASSSTDWSVMTLQPDPGVPAPGELDLIALVGSPSLSAQFTQDFTYLGLNTPGLQPFTHYDDAFTPLSSGSTDPAGAGSATPEPSTFLLLGGALAAAWLFGRRICGAAILPAAGVLLLAGMSANAEIRVTGRTLLSSTRVDLTNYDYTYSVQVQNLGGAVTQVSAVVSSFAAATKVQSANLTFPDMPAGGTASSVNAYTIRQNRTVPIDHSLIRLAFSAIAAPVADAGPDQFITALNAPFNAQFDWISPPWCCMLNGRGSYDPFGRPLTYRWKLLSRPAGSKTGDPLSNLTQNSVSASVTANIVPDTPGDYVVQLIVNNGYLDSAPSLVRFSTSAVPPKANAGPDQTIQAGHNVQLDGTRSVNPMDRPLAYSWSVISSPAGGSNAVLSDPTSPRPTLFPVVPGTYKLQLQVTDGALTSAPSVVTLTTGNTPPRADAGPDLHIGNGSWGFLAANRSTDVNGDFLTYRWAILSGPVPGVPAPVLPPVPNPDLFVPEGATFHVQLFVHDGYSESISTQVVTGQWIIGLLPPSSMLSVLPAVPAVTRTNSSPLTFALDATPSFNTDTNWGTGWSLLYRPPTSIATVPSTGLTVPFAPDRDGVYVAQLKTSFWGYWSNPTAIGIVTHGALPIANAGTTQFGLWTAPAIHTLNASASYDPDGHSLTYRWALLAKPAGSTAQLSSLIAVDPWFTADLDGTYVFQLVVNNGLADSLPATVSVISKDNERPVALDTSVRNPWKSPCVPVTVTAKDKETTGAELLLEFLNAPQQGFLSVDTHILGTFGVSIDPATGQFTLGESAMCYYPFQSTYTGFDEFNFRVWDSGYPAGCGTAGPYCIGPKVSEVHIAIIDIFEGPCFNPPFCAANRPTAAATNNSQGLRP